MSRNVILRPRAEEDIDDFYFYLAIDCDSAAAADRFLSCVEAALERLSEFPNIGTEQDVSDARLAGLRLWPIPGFDDRLIYYRVGETAIDIVRILGGPQDRRTMLRRY